MDTPDIGLRELKKQMTRDSIADAALKLTLEKGLSDVTIEEIASLAFVSPRTVSNYFSGKEEAVVAAGTHDSDSIIEELANRPLSEPPMHSLRELMVEYARSRTPMQLKLSLQKLELERENPSIRPFGMAQYDELEGALREVVAERTGTSLDTDMYPWLVAAAAVSAVRTAMRMWAGSGAAAGRLPELVQLAFDQLGEGLPAPKRHSEPDATDDGDGGTT